MAALLAEVARNADPASNPYLNDRRAKYFEKLAEQVSDSQEQILVRVTLAKELLRAGQTQAAIKHFREVKSFLSNQSRRTNPEYLLQLDDWLGISYLRLAEQDNCVALHGAQSCLFPIAGAGVHRNQRGARAAINAYTALLHNRPDDLGYRWLLNLAYMALGEHPDAVPSQWRIDPEFFEADADIGRFRDVAPKLGLDVTGLAGGVVAEDFDADGTLDIMVSSWGLTDQLRYFRNNADGTFSERTVQAGLTGIVGGLNLVHADYNNDGFPDVFVLRGAWMAEGGRHPNSLLHNNGDGTFEDVTQRAGLLSFHPTQTAAWADYNNDGYVDLFVGNESVAADVNPCELFHNNGDGTFTECAAARGVQVAGYVKAVTWGDYDRDGLPDLYCSRWGEPNLLLRNAGPQSPAGDPGGAAIAIDSPSAPWTFHDVTQQAGVDQPHCSFPAWFWDYDNDGRLDLYVASYFADDPLNDPVADYLGLPHSGEPPKLYHNRGDGTFTDVTVQAQLDQLLDGMGCNFGDVDNDGFADFYLGTGEPDLRVLFPNRLFRNVGGVFFQDVTTSAGAGHLQKGHGVAIADIDNDGDSDIYAVMGGSFTGDTFQNVLFENPGNEHHWLRVRVLGTRSHRAAIGARIRLETEVAGLPRNTFAVVGTGASFGSSSLQQEIGLGKADRIAMLEVTWPSGRVQSFQSVPMDRFIHIVEGEEQLRPMPLDVLDLAESRPLRRHADSHHHHRRAP